MMVQQCHGSLRPDSTDTVFLFATKLRMLKAGSLYTPKESRSIKTAIFIES
jgi:hypothetical protein